MSAARRNLEARFRPLSMGAVLLFSASLALGLALYLLLPDERLGMLALNFGLLVLIASPAIRIGVALAERIRRRDWAFVVMTLAVIVELMVVVWRAARA